MGSKLSWRAVSIRERLAQFPRADVPLKQEAVIYWNDWAVPFIRAGDDADLFFLFGLVHAHLRLVQMELMRRIASGRLAEVFGPIAFPEIDRALRIVGIDAAVPAIERNLPPETKGALSDYVRGVNFLIAHLRMKPPEFRLFAISPRPWIVEDVLRVSRLASLDINWIYWFQMLGLAQERAFPLFYERLKKHGKTSLPSFGGDSAGDLLMASTKSGSNCFAAAGERTETRSAFLANDPHLGLHVPNVWLAASAVSPGIKAAGLMLPGIPAFLIGRNEHIGWGGTNMLARSSVLYDASNLETAETEETIRRRFFFPQRTKVRLTAAGRLITDIPAVKKRTSAAIALQWRGHEASDEITAFLRIVRAESWDEFKQAYCTYAVSGQNFLFASRDGSIGQLSALETSSSLPPGDRFLETYEGPKAGAVLRCADLPSVYRPESGFLVSANNPPSAGSPNLSFFSLSNERFNRMSFLLRGDSALTLEGVKRVQTDVFSEASFQFAQRLCRLAGDGKSELIARLRMWDGEYKKDSRGAAAFQILLYHLVTALYGRLYGGKIASFLLSSHAVIDFLKEDIEDGQNAGVLQEAIQRAERDFKHAASWGGMHRLKLAHPFAAIPILGRMFKVLDLAVDGASWTVSKTANALSPGKHAVQYGVSARFIADMSDEDDAHVVLAGGQDGWLGSNNLLDQIPLWQEQKYLRLPLKEETARTSYSHRTVFSPVR